MNRSAITFILLLWPLLLMAQPEREGYEGRPKVGLVLSGGGARGAAHIGVLKTLEELRIPVDYIAGTSMGAIIGGLYASGMSPDEIEEWMREADWHYLLSDAPPREIRSIRNKERDYDLPQGIELGVSRSGVVLPSGFVAGQKLIFRLRQLTMPVSEVKHFDRLPIPFRAVATDLETGEMVVLDSGSLADAIRASMAVPGIFTPHHHQGRVLIDGGLASNLPIQVAQDMGADIIIAADVRAPLRKEEDLGSALDVANQSMDILVQRFTMAEINRLTPRDVYIQMPMPDATSADFAGAYQNIPAGYDAAMESAARLRPLGVSPQAWGRFVARHRIPRDEGMLVEFIEVETPEGRPRQRFEVDLVITPDEPLDFERLESELLGVQALGDFRMVDYEVIERDGQRGVVVRTTEKPWGPNYLHFGFNFGYRSTGESDANIRLLLRMTELNALGAQWENFISIGDYGAIHSEFYQPLDWDRSFFVAPQLFYASEFIDGTDEQQQPIRFRLQTVGGALDGGWRLGNTGELRIGYEYGWSKLDRAVGLPDDLQGWISRGAATSRLLIDTLDSAFFPTSGYYAQANFRFSREELGADANYARLWGQIYKPLTFGRHTVIPRLQGGMKLGTEELPLYDQFQLGGFLNLSGLARGELYDQNLLLAELIYFSQIARLPPGFGNGVFAGASVEAGNVWSDQIRPGDSRFAGSVFLGAETVAGPLYLGLGVADGGETALYLQLGPVFGQGRSIRR